MTSLLIELKREEQRFLEFFMGRQFRTYEEYLKHEEELRKIRRRIQDEEERERRAISYPAQAGTYYPYRNDLWEDFSRPPMDFCSCARCLSKAKTKEFLDWKKTHTLPF